ncbi:MAG: D-alanyl-D-alanine carboxypeptidase/D-alanyl-D-alanine-endopeptidase, partial [Gemmatimonadaceae bacterium]|nr:D-alanyl-D-alanine carboxypeptidase/D-alanyl-D-alanine-endopeptidase [Gemmatimonadaceae bacterium]
MAGTRTMRPVLLAAVLFGAACAPTQQTVVSTSLPVQPVLIAMQPIDVLRHDIDSLVSNTKFRNAHFGVLIVNPVTGDTLYSRNASKIMMPASNMKIITGAVALAQLGPDYRYTTRFASRGTVTKGVLKGDLVVIGNGDPTVSDRMRTNDAMNALRDMADSLGAHGITRIDGKLVPGGDAFPGTNYGYGWELGYLDDYYAAPVDELNYSEGMDKVPAKTKAGKDTLVEVVSKQPLKSYMFYLHRALGERGIKVSGGPGDSTMRADTTGLRTIFEFRSLPLKDILFVLENPSQNQTGEILLRTLGLEKTGYGLPDSGIAVVERQLLAWGIEKDGFQIADGSGLARRDLISPETVVRTLVVMLRPEYREVFLASLATPGGPGTLRKRLKNTPAANNLRAKTGSIGNARSLSGYINTADAQPLVFSLLLNNYTVDD